MAQDPSLNLAQRLLLASQGIAPLAVKSALVRLEYLTSPATPEAQFVLSHYCDGTATTTTTTTPAT